MNIEETEEYQLIPNIGNIGINQTIEQYDECEWCFQFDDDEPFVFAAGVKTENENPNLMFKIENKSNSILTFSYNGKKFNIFARKLSEAGKKLINE